MTQVPKQLVWTERYSIGVADLDAQHQALLDILNILNRAAAKDLSSQRVKDLLWSIFEELNEYAAYHFLTEEKLLQSYLPTENATVKHIAQHRNYWVTTSEFKTRYREGDARVVSDLVKFLNTWWIDHILGIDMQMGDELNRKGVR